MEDRDGYKGRFGGHLPLILHWTVNMNRLHFILVRGCAQTLVPPTVLPIVSSRIWPDILKEIGTIHWGRLLSLYAYMARSNAPLREQYTFHLSLYNTYQSHYRSSWWMVGHILKYPWLLLWEGIKDRWIKLHFSFVTQPWVTLQVAFARVLPLLWL